MKALITGFLKGIAYVLIAVSLLIWGITKVHAEGTFNITICNIKLQERENQAAYLEYFRYNVANGIPKLSLRDMKRNLDDLDVRERRLYDAPIKECQQ